jgi:hypothetical protein
MRSAPQSHSSRTVIRARASRPLQRYSIALAPKATSSRTSPARWLITKSDRRRRRYRLAGQPQRQRCDRLHRSLARRLAGNTNALAEPAPGHVLNGTGVQQRAAGGAQGSSALAKPRGRVDLPVGEVGAAQGAAIYPDPPMRGPGRAGAFSPVAPGDRGLELLAVYAPALRQAGEPGMHPPALAELRGVDLGRASTSWCWRYASEGELEGSWRRQRPLQRRRCGPGHRQRPADRGCHRPLWRRCWPCRRGSGEGSADRAGGSLHPPNRPGWPLERREPGRRCNRTCQVGSR